MKWAVTVTIVVVGVGLMWHFGILQEIGGAFKVWLEWIGAYR